MMMWLKRRICRRRGHSWFPPFGPRQFLPVTATCWRCGEKRSFMPWGKCLGGHPLAEHYDFVEGQLVMYRDVPNCSAGGPS